MSYSYSLIVDYDMKIKIVKGETKKTKNNTYMICPTCEDKLCWYDNQDNQQVFGCYQCETKL